MLLPRPHLKVNTMKTVQAWTFPGDYIFYEHDQHLICAGWVQDWKICQLWFSVNYLTMSKFNVRSLHRHRLKCGVLQNLLTVDLFVIRIWKSSYFLLSIWRNNMMVSVMHFNNWKVGERKIPNKKNLGFVKFLRSMVINMKPT